MSGRVQDDLTGRRFGYLTVLEYAGRENGHSCWSCRCDCGKTVCVRSDKLKNGADVSCGCKSKRKTRNLEGCRFGALLVMRKSNDALKHVVWECRCDCGATVYKRTDALIGGVWPSCGCMDPHRARDLTGQRFGRLTVQRKVGSDRGSVWECQCDCGNTVMKTAKHLLDGTAKSCGCITAERCEDLTGRKFGRLTVLGRAEKPSARGDVLWRCRCDCGNTTLVRRYELKSGGTVSCGCASQEFGRTKLRDYQTYVDGTCIEFLAFMDKPTRANTTGVRGVCRLKNGRYEAYIGFKKRKIFLGKYDHFGDAVSARKQGEKMIQEYLERYYDECV